MNDEKQAATEETAPAGADTAQPEETAAENKPEKGKKEKGKKEKAQDDKGKNAKKGKKK